MWLLVQSRPEPILSGVFGQTVLGKSAQEDQQNEKDHYEK